MASATNNAVVYPILDPKSACFRDAVEYQTDESRNCEEAGCSGYCNCTKIDKAWVTSTESMGPHSLKLITPKPGKRFPPRYQPTQIESYCIQRLMVHHECYVNSSYEIQVSGGHYGQEVGRVEFIHLDALSKDIHTMLALPSDHAKVMFVLNAEYGYISPAVRDTNAVELIHKPLDNIQPSAGLLMLKRPKNYLHKLGKESVVGVILNGVLVDGNQRYSYLIGTYGGSYVGTYLNLFRDDIGCELAVAVSLGKQ